VTIEEKITYDSWGDDDITNLHARIDYHADAIVANELLRANADAMTWVRQKMAWKIREKVAKDLYESEVADSQGKSIDSLLGRKLVVSRDVPPDTIIIHPEALMDMERLFLKLNFDWGRLKAEEGEVAP
jgi:hypothetical protein